MLPLALHLSLALVTQPAARATDVVAFEGKASADLEASINDLLTTLQRMTHRPWQRLPKSAQGIQLRKVPENERGFGGHTPEAYRIRAQGPQVELEATDEKGLVLAIYDLLDRLGARWPGPGEVFTVIPERPELNLKILPTLIEPRFRMREFFGTGGVGIQTRVDPSGALQSAWRDYQRRNRWGASEHISGHAGTSFALNHRAELESHSDWRAWVGGARTPWSPNLKLCASSTGARDAFVADRVSALSGLLAKDPTTFAVSVEPADGGGHCECDRCRALGGPSDGVFELANQVAREVRRKFPGKWVSLYAYNEHADIPRAPIEPNVFVMVCPYGLHRTGLEPDELIDAWSKKVARLGVYDYWALPDWNRELPGLDPVAMGRRIEQWHDHHIEAFMLESSFGVAANGPALWSASRHFFAKPGQVDPGFEEWLSLVFGPAKDAVRPLFVDWFKGYVASEDTLGRAFEALERAVHDTATDPQARARVLIFVRYVEYLRLRLILDQTPKSDPLRLERTRALLRWILSIAPDLSVASFRLYKLILRDEDPNKVLAREFSLDDPSAPGWSTLITPEATDTLRRLAEARAQHPARPNARASFEGKWVPAPQRSTEKKARGRERSLAMSGRVALSLQARTSTVITVELTKASRAPTRVKLTDEAGKAVEKCVLVDGSLSCKLHLSAGRRYLLTIVDPKNQYRIGLPAAVQMGFSDFSSPLATPTLYFYVPADQGRVLLEVPSVRPVRLVDADGKTVAEAPMGGLLEAPVAKDQAGRVWSIQGYHSWLPIRALSVPQAFSLDPEDLLIPSGAVRPPRH
ncbi:MAG: DUF4838 domain-containing protein [Myxococcota bacterium]